MDAMCEQTVVGEVLLSGIPSVMERKGISNRNCLYILFLLF